MTDKELTNKIKIGILANRPLCFAHRGASGLVKENSLQAIMLASLIKGCDGIEFDVHGTGDGQLIVRHNFALKTNKGNKWIRKLFLEEIRKYLSEDESPLLINVLNTLKDYSGVIDIEIKQKGITKSVIDLCKKKEIYKKVVFTTVNKEIYREIREVDKSVAIIFGYPKEKGKDLSQKNWVRPFVRVVTKLMKNRLMKITQKMISEIDTPFISFYHKIITAKVVEYLHQNNRYCIGATINVHNDTGWEESIETMRSMVNSKVDLIKTDYPNLFNHALKTETKS